VELLPHSPVLGTGRGVTQRNPKKVSGTRKMIEEVTSRKKKDDNRG